jgi:hypothetical protein
MALNFKKGEEHVLKKAQNVCLALLQVYKRFMVVKSRRKVAHLNDMRIFLRTQSGNT